MWDELQRGVKKLSEETQAWLRQNVPWLFTAGRWVRDTSGQIYQWVTDTGQVVARWTMDQLKAVWREIVRVTDLTWELLKSIDWGQILMTIVKGLCVIVIGVVVAAGAVVVASAEVVLVVPEALVAGLIALIGIFAVVKVAPPAKSPSIQTIGN